MKTTKLFAVVSFALILGIANAHTGKVPLPGKSSSVGPLVRYQVNIHVSGEQSGCRVYWVQITDLRGVQVAPYQVYNPSVSTYTFYEAGTVRGVRTARIVLGPSLGGFACQSSLSAAPAVMVGDFLAGSTYTFDLFPTNVAPDKE